MYRLLMIFTVFIGAGCKKAAPVSTDAVVISDACPGERASPFEPVLVSADMLPKRLGAGAKQFSALKTTAARPVEVCMVNEQLSVLTTLTCDDGSNPFASPQAAHASRSGNVGPGGRCGSIIDLYRVPCPEGDYDVHMDMYVCAE